VSTPFFFFGYRKDAPFFILSSTTFGYSSLYHARVAQGSTAFDVGAQEINRWTAAMIQANPGR